tara:strand:+ start:427 stop:1275 length:849 start_codon:yes stop_codon:yes gene_type:complete
MKLKILLLPLVIFFQIDLIHGQGWDLTVRKNVFDKNQIAKPAQLNIIIPDSGSDSYSINTGISLIKESAYVTEYFQFEYGFSGEYHRNSKIDKEQNILAGSVAGFSIIRLPTEKTVKFINTLAIKFKSDFENNTESLHTDLKIVPIIPHWDISDYFGPDNFKFLFEPSGGFYYETILKDSKNLDGSIIRGYSTGALGIYPFWENTEEMIQITIDKTWWFDLFERDFLSNDQTTDPELLEIALQIYFNKAKNAGLRFEYIDGTDPKINLFDQEYFQVSFTFKR